MCYSTVTISAKVASAPESQVQYNVQRITVEEKIIRVSLKQIGQLGEKSRLNFILKTKSILIIQHALAMYLSIFVI